MFCRDTRKEDKIGDDPESKKEILKREGTREKNLFFLKRNFKPGDIKERLSIPEIITIHRKYCRFAGKGSCIPAYSTHRGA